MCSARRERPLRLVIVVASLEGGGTERFASLLSGEMARRGHQVTVVTLVGAERDFFELSPLVRRHAVDASRTSASLLHGARNNVRAWWRLRRILREERPDVVIALGWSTNIIVLTAVRGLRQAVMVSERTNPSRHSIPAVWRVLRRLTYPFAARLVVQTSEVERVVRRWVKSRRVVVLPNPVLPEALALESVEGDRPFVVAMGRLSEEKGYDVLLSAMALVITDQPDARLAVFGDGPLRGELEEQAASLGLSDSVSFAGQTTSPHTQMATAWCYVLCSRFEGFPNALLEAMALGLPVVSTDCQSGPRDLVDSGRTGVLVPVDDVPALALAITQILKDGELRARLGSAARDRARELSLPTVVDLWEREVLGVASASRR